MSTRLAKGFPDFQSGKFIRFTLPLIVVLFFSGFSSFAQKSPVLQYEISFPQPASHLYQVELQTRGWHQDTLQFKMPKWMPGYYQIMDYANGVENMLAQDAKGRTLPLTRLNENTWQVTGIYNKAFTLQYNIKTNKQFVANSFVDSAHAYLIPGNTFLYADGFLQMPVSVKINKYPQWEKIATGLDQVPGKPNEFTAPDFDILYDCPILIGDLEELPSFWIKGIEHRFIGYQIGNFNRTEFIENLRKTVEAGINIIGDIPYKQYTFIAIGPGRGGIEHLNNTTISFDGNELQTSEAKNKILNFLAHEYFHHYNVKRIRPFELGPFDYDKGSKTNLLWVSEGISVYYEYLMVKRAGLADAQTLFQNLNKNINAVENNAGRLYQSLAQASYRTWKDGPFGTQGDEPGKSISYYDKGPLVGLLLDFEIRHKTQNKKSLDDVMRLLYWQYYKKEKRGFTDAEFQQACETVAGTSLTSIFEYVYTTKELNYNTYLAYAGLRLDEQNKEVNLSTKTRQFTISPMAQADAMQAAILKSWLGE